MPRFRPRISLLSALLLMTIAGMAIVIGQLWRDVGPLRAEVRQLRNETGKLLIEDAQDVFVTSLRPSETVQESKTRTWKWRVYTPAGPSFAIRGAISSVDDKSRLPTPAPNELEIPIASGEHLIQVELDKQPDMSWRVRISRQDAPASEFTHFPDLREITLPWPIQWPGYRAGYGWSGIMGDAQQRFQADEPLLLLRLYPEFTPDDVSGRSPSDNKRLREGVKQPTETLYLWIEERRPAASDRSK